MKKDELFKLASELGVNTERLTYNEVKSAVVAIQKQHKVKSESNTAIVYRGNHEVRRYDIETHGDEFAVMAGEFAAQYPEYRVVLTIVNKHNATCPNCGSSFYFEQPTQD